MFSLHDALIQTLGNEIKKLQTENQKYCTDFVSIRSKIYNLENKPLPTEELVAIILQNDDSQLTIPEDNLSIDQNKITALQNQQKELIEQGHIRYLIIEDIICVLEKEKIQCKKDKEQLQLYIRLTATLTKFLKNESTPTELTNLLKSFPLGPLNENFNRNRNISRILLGTCVGLLVATTIFGLIWGGFIAAPIIPLAVVMGVCLSSAAAAIITGIASFCIMMNAIVEYDSNPKVRIVNDLEHLRINALPDNIANSRQPEHVVYYRR